MENWKEVYLQIAERINSGLPEIAWVDLWHEQVPNTDDEYGFPSPAVFVAFRSTKISDRTNLVQEVELQVDLYLFQETTAKSQQGSSNQAEALGYLDTLTKLNKFFHGYTTETFSTMRKIDISCIDSSMSRYLYRISFSCMLEDTSAMPTYAERTYDEIEIINSLSKNIDNKPSLSFGNSFFYID
jgi:hypothetical protein